MSQRFLLNGCLLGIFFWMIIAQGAENETFYECGKSTKMLNDCFSELSPDYMTYLNTNNIPITEKEIMGKCIVFKQGMRCIDSYLKKCIESDQKKIFDNNVFGAKQFLNALCDNKKFQREYLNQKDCLHFIEDDWQRCSAKFISILKDELNTPTTTMNNMSTRYMQFCCSRYAYERCIFNSAKFKCEINSAHFVRGIVRMLSSEKHFSNCASFENLMCSAMVYTSVKISHVIQIVAIILTIFFVNEIRFKIFVN